MPAIPHSGIDPNHHKGLLAVDDVTGEPFAVQGDAATGAINITGTITAASDGAIVDGVSSSIKATVFDYTNSNPLSVRLTDTNGDYIAAGAGTQYTEDAAAAANPVGTALNLVRDDSRSGSITSADGDNIAARGTNAGELYVKHVDSVAVTNAGLTELAGAINASAQMDVNIAASNATVAVSNAGLTELAGAIDTEVQVDVVGALPAGDNNIGNVDVASSALPTGAATAANQTTGNTSLATIAGAVSGTEMQVDVLTMPTTTVQATNLDIRDLSSASDSVTADTELTTADLDTGAGTDTRAVVGLVGSASGGGQLIPGSATDGLLVNLGANNDVTVTGSVTANAGTNLNTSALALESGGNLASVAASLAVLDDWDESDRAKVNLIAGQAGITAGAGSVAANTPRVTHASDDPAVTALQLIDNIVPSINGAGAPTVDSYSNASVSASANTANQSLISAPGANKQIWVYGIVGSADTGDGSISLQDEDDTALTGVMEVTRRGGFVVSPSGNFAMPWFKVATNKALEIDTVTCGFKGVLSYAIVSV